MPLGARSVLAVVAAVVGGLGLHAAPFRAECTLLSRFPLDDMHG
jgi:hypothetical protein